MTFSSGPPVVLATTATVRGGVWRHIEDLAIALREHGREVAVALVPAATELRRRAQARSLPTVDFARSALRPRTIWHGHLHDTYARAFLAAALARRALGPTVLTEHLPHSNASDPALAPGPRHPLAGPAKTVFKRTQFRCADAVIAVSESSAAFLRRRYGLAGDAIAVVPNGIEPSAPAPAPAAPEPTPTLGEGPVLVVSPGALIYQKGHDVLLAAAARAGGGWRAEVLGEGPMREPLARAAAAQRLPVGFPGWSDDVGGALARAQIVCLPSRWEAAPYAALEAMGAGRALVASDVDGLRDLVQHGVTGLLVAPDDAGALADAIDRLAGDPQRRAQMGAAARARAGAFTVSAMAQATVAVYDAAAARRRAGGAQTSSGS